MPARPAAVQRAKIVNREALVAVPSPEARALALDMVEGALAAVEPEAATRRALARARADGLALEGAWIVALGKAAWPMARAASEALGSERGVVVAPSVAPIGGLQMRRGEHPASGERALENGEALLSLARGIPSGDAVVCLISGGGSAMVEALPEGASADDLVDFQRALLASGAPIDAMNALRRRLSRLKGGGLAAALSHTRLVTVVISDTPGHPPSTVASGPTLAPEAEVDVEPILRAYDLESRLGPSVLAAIRAGRGVARLAPSPLYVAADNATACAAAAAVADARGRDVTRVRVPFAGEARARGAALYRDARARGAEVMVAGGETTVTLVGEGRGGRNHEILLGALGDFEGGLVVGVGTDGVDGTSGAAGALLDDAVIAGAAAAGMDPHALLLDNDSARYFEAAGAQLITGPTQTNVADLWLYVRDRA